MDDWIKGIDGNVSVEENQDSTFSVACTDGRDEYVCIDLTREQLLEFRNKINDVLGE